MKNRKGQGVVAGIISGLVTLGSIVASYFAIEKIIQLFTTIVDNLFYIGIMSIVFIGGFTFLYYVRQGRLSKKYAAAGFIGLLVVGLAFPIAGIKLSDSVQDYKADIVVDTSEPIVGGEISFDQLYFEDIGLEDANQLSIQEQQACLLNCGDWTVEATVQCGSWSKQVTVTGQGGDSGRQTVYGMPSGSQCNVVGEMVRPENHGGPNTIDGSFVTG